MSNIVEYDNLIAFHPGSYVEELIEDLNITQAEYAERLGTTPKTLSKLVNGKDKLTPTLAIKLEQISGISVNTWLNLQAAFDSKMLEIKEQESLNLDIPIVQELDFTKLKQVGLIEDKRYSKIEKVKIGRKLFNRSELTQLGKFDPAVSYRRKDNESLKSIVNSNAVLELGIRAARDFPAKSYRNKALQEAMPKIREILADMSVSFFDELRQLFHQVGIVLVAVPALSGAGLNGAVKKMKDGSVLLVVTDRNKSADVFWFSLLHEVGHIVNADFASSYENKDYEHSETKADKFATDFLMDKKSYESFTEKSTFTEESIKEFAKQQNLPAFIVLGRLQRDQFVGYDAFSHLKMKCQVSASIA